MKGHTKAEVNGCLSKNRYCTRELAEAARLGAEIEWRVALRVYECEFCRGFHLTKKPMNQKHTTTFQPRLQVMTLRYGGR